MYMEDNVLEKAKERFRYLHNEFDYMVAAISGGKDSTVVFELAYETAKEMDELPLYCMWLDQEAEYQATEDIVRGWMNRDGVEPIWMQCEFKMGNGAGHEQEFLHAWDQDLDAGDLMRPRDPMAIHGDAQEKYGEDRFYDLFTPVAHEHTPEGSVASVSGVRAEESPNRELGLTNSNTYKGITWGAKTSEHEQYTFYPVYDWSYGDVWKFIHDNDIEYNEIYDKQFRYGVPIRNMRVSHLHHEQAVENLFRLQEFEPETFNALVDRVDGIHSTARLGEEGLSPNDLPWMFEDWREYRNYLLVKLIDDEEDVLTFNQNFMTQDLMLEHREQDSFPNQSYDGITAGHVWGIMQNDNEADGFLQQMRSSASNGMTQLLRDAKYKWLYKHARDVWDECVEKEYIASDEAIKTRLGLHDDEEEEPMPVDIEEEVITVYPDEVEL